MVIQEFTPNYRARLQAVWPTTSWEYAVTIDRGAKQIVGAGTAAATEPTREHKQYTTQGPTTYLCT